MARPATDPSADAALLARVRAYPHPPADERAGAPPAEPPPQPERLARALDDARAGRRVGLLAYGANRSAVLLREKLGEAAARVLATNGTLADHDVVFSAHVSPYGAIPATLRRSPGTRVAVGLLLCPAEALPALDATEPNYVRVVLGDACVALDGGLTAPTVLEAYVSRHGCLALDGSAVALADVAAGGRRLPALSEEQVLERVRDLLEPDTPFDHFVLAGIRSPRVRATRTRRLRAEALPGAESSGARV